MGHRIYIGPQGYRRRPRDARDAIARFPSNAKAWTVVDARIGRNANGQSVAYVYIRDNDADARQAKVLTNDEAQRIAVNIARLPELLVRTGSD